MRFLAGSLVTAGLLIFLTSAGNPDHHVKASLEAAPGSHIEGFVNITQLPHGGASVSVVARGLEPGKVYASFYYESANCTEPADLLGTFTAMPNGTGEVHGKIDDDVDEVGSVSVRVGPGYGDLMGCAKMH